MSNGYDRTLLDPRDSAARPFIPEYLCHKRVRALQIKTVVKLNTDEEYVASLYFKDPRFAPIVVTGAVLTRYYPIAGDYYVVYAGDGYVSFSPQKAFEDGYTLVGNVAPGPVTEPHVYRASNACFHCKRGPQDHVGPEMACP